MKRYLIGACAGILATTVFFWGTGLMPLSDQITAQNLLSDEKITSTAPPPTVIDAKAYTVKTLNPYQTQLNINQLLQDENTQLKHQLIKMKEEHFLSEERSKYFYNSGQKNGDPNQTTSHNELYKSDALANRANLEEDAFNDSAIGAQ